MSAINNEDIKIQSKEEQLVNEIIKKVNNISVNEDNNSNKSNDPELESSASPLEMNEENLNLRQIHLDRLRSWLNHRMTIEMTDGRILVGTFLCTDRDANVILGSCGEYLNSKVFENSKDDNILQGARMLGLVMIPGQHIVNILYDCPQYNNDIS